jgi:hypothetical protein
LPWRAAQDFDVLLLRLPTPHRQRFQRRGFYASEQMTVVAGAESVFERPSASGFPVAFHFCPRCGANLYWVPHRMANLVGVAIGAFADPDFPSPEQVVWTEEMQRWTPLPNGLPCFEQSPPPRLRTH